jgi:uncharacterized protein (DUF111 family)
MRVAFFDCSRGISGLASLAALLDAGADVAEVTTRLDFLGREHPFVQADDVMLDAFRARMVSVEAGDVTMAQGLADIEGLVGGGSLPPAVRDLVLGVYGRLAEAEARVHGSSPDAVRFHEVGSLRSIVGVVGTALALEQLGIERIVASAVPFGWGEVETDHGRLPLPAPATLELLHGMPVMPQEMPEELVTPTGAAILAAVASGFGTIPPMTIDSVGYGTGGSSSSGILLRVVVGEAAHDV